MTFLSLFSSSELGVYRSSPWWRSGSLPKAPSSLYGGPSAQSPSSPSQNPFRSRGFWACLRWGLFAGAGVWLGLSGLVADQLSGHGQVIEAAKVFTWNRYIRTRPGYKAIMKGGPVEDVVAALASDPWSADLTYGAGILYHLHGNDRMADLYAKQFIKIAPNSKIVERLQHAETNH